MTQYILGMERRPRIEFEGTFFQLIDRSMQRQQIFKNRDGCERRVMHHIAGFAKKVFSILLVSILPFSYGCTDSSLPPQKKSAANYQAEGKKVFSEGKYKEAIEIWSKQLESNPRNVNALISIGIAHHELGNYQVALEYHNKALEINPNNPHPYFSRGRAYHSLKNYDLAEQDFKKAIESKWRLPSSYYNLFVVYKEMRNCEKAELIFRKLSELKAFVKEAEQELIECYLLSGMKEKAIEHLSEVLNTEDSSAREYAIRKLAETKHPNAVDPLIRVLIKDQSYPSAYALANIGIPALEPLEKVLQSRDKEVRWLVLTALDKISHPRTVDSFILGLKDDDPGIRALAAQVLGSKQEVGALVPLAEALKDADWKVRESAVKSLGEIKSTGQHPVEATISILKDENNDVRKRAIETLGKIQDGRAVEPLIEILKDPEFEVRRNAMAALGRIKDHRAVGPLLVFLKDEDPRLRLSAADALSEIGDFRAVESLVVSLNDQDTLVRKNAATALGKIRDPRSVDALIGALKKDTPVKPFAAKALGEIGDLRAVEPLITALKIDHPIREYFNKRIENSFPSHGSGSPVLFLLMAPFAPLFQDNAPMIREYACGALGKLKDPRAVKPLIEALKDRNFLVRKSAAEALAEIDDPRMAEYLSPLLKHEVPEIREGAIRVQKRMAEKRSSP